MWTHKRCDVILALLTFCLLMYTIKAKLKVDRQYYLTSQALTLARNLFDKGRDNYEQLKRKSVEAIDTFLDLVHIMNDVMARELRSAVVKFYRVKYFHDFTNYIISMEEIVEIIDHCLLEPVEKLELLRKEFRENIRNFADIRNFAQVEKCNDNLPDEVATAHCILHQAVLFNETMQNSLTTIVEIKSRQFAQDMNASLYDVQRCLNYFVPKFFQQLLVDAYTDNSPYLRVVNASIADLVKDRWTKNMTNFPKKWTPLVNNLKDIVKKKTGESIQDPLWLTLLAANISSHEMLNTLHRRHDELEWESIITDRRAEENM